MCWRDHKGLSLNLVKHNFIVNRRDKSRFLWYSESSLLETKGKVYSNRFTITKSIHSHVPSSDMIREMKNITIFDGSIFQFLIFSKIFR